jgi:hypothetical protein
MSGAITDAQAIKVDFGYGAIASTKVKGGNHYSYGEGR